MSQRALPKRSPEQRSPTVHFLSRLLLLASLTLLAALGCTRSSSGENIATTSSVATTEVIVPPAVTAALGELTKQEVEAQAIQRAQGQLGMEGPPLSIRSKKMVRAEYWARFGWGGPSETIETLKQYAWLVVMRGNLQGPSGPLPNSIVIVYMEPTGRILQIGGAREGTFKDLDVEITPQEIAAAEQRVAAEFQQAPPGRSTVSPPGAPTATPPR